MHQWLLGYSGHYDNPQLLPASRANLLSAKLDANPAMGAVHRRFFASDESSCVNGHALVVDGGLSISHPFNHQEYGKTAF